ncbi:MAG: M67 family metallopeptidase [Bacillota bacterium]
MIKISRGHVECIIQQAREHLPVECCGILAGRVEGESIEVVDVYSMTNVDQSPEHFSLDPEEQFKVYYVIREKGLKLLGNYHSHPASPARPSQEDIRLAYDPEAVYMILSLQEEIPVLRAFRIQNGEYAEILLEIEE